MVLVREKGQLPIRLWLNNKLRHFAMSCFLQRELTALHLFFLTYCTHFDAGWVLPISPNSRRAEGMVEEVKEETDWPVRIFLLQIFNKSRNYGSTKRNALTEYLPTRVNKVPSLGSFIRLLCSRVTVLCMHLILANRHNTSSFLIDISKLQVRCWRVRVCVLHAKSSFHTW